MGQGILSLHGTPDGIHSATELRQHTVARRVGYAASMRRNQSIQDFSARGEGITCILLNNGVFGETGGHMTATSVLGQRTKSSLDGRDAEYHGYPILIGDLIARLQGAAYVARGSVHNAGAVARTKKMFRRAFETQLRGEGFSFVEVLTMCPTGWFIPTADGPDYMSSTLGEVHIMGELKVDGVVRSTEELHEENMRKAAEMEHALARGGIDDHHE